MLKVSVMTDPFSKQSKKREQLHQFRGVTSVCADCLQVARKLVILEGDLERSEERAEVAEA